MEAGEKNRLMTKRKVWENFQNNLRNIVNVLENENAQPEAVKESVRQLQGVVDSAMITRYLIEIYDWEEIQCRLVRMKKHDLTRKEMLAELNNVLARLEALIAAELSKEKKTEKLRQFFLACAEHAKEIAEIIDLENLLN